jgi:hypothetical protein
MDWIYPIIAIVIVFATPKGCYQTIAIVLSVLLIAHYGWEVYIIEGGYYDTYWHDVYMLGIYSIAAYTFHRLCGNWQVKLAGVGVGLSLLYLIGWMYVPYPHDYYYKEAMVILTIAQLLAASRGASWSLLNKTADWVLHGRAARITHHGVGRRTLPRNNP